MKRYLEMQIRKDLKRKMVFVGGPRQVGKTTLAKSLLTCLVERHSVRGFMGYMWRGEVR